MLHNFPDPYPEELFYSVCARYSETMFFLSEEKVGQYLFGKRNPRPVIDFPTSLTHLVRNLSPNAGYDEDFYINNHSLLPYYTPFLSPERMQIARQSMRDGYNNGLHTIIGNTNSHSNNIETLYYCPKCAEENRHQYGETYWHRVHQLPDVHICPKHSLWLMPCKDYNPHTRIYVSADEVIPVNDVVMPVNPSNDADALLLYIAIQSLWLLQHPAVLTTPEFLRQQYAVAFHNIGLASYGGSIQSSKILQTFRQNYPDSLLQRLKCSLEQSVNKNWLTGRLLRDDRHSYPTIRHLVTLHFLDMTVREFVEDELQRHPFGIGKFPCLNLICKYYRQFVIEDVRVEENDYGDASGFFKCPECGFEYLRHGPDLEARLWTHAIKIINYGHIWETKLSNLIETGLSLNKIAKELRAGKATIKKQIDKLGLPMPQGSKAKRVAYDPYIAAVDPQKLKSLKQAWMDKQVEDPTISLNELRSELEYGYYYIRQWDKEWLNDHSPELKKRGSDATDWKVLDSEYMSQIPPVVEVILAADPPEQVTLAGISRAMGLRSTYITRHKENLDQTYNLAMGLRESEVDFAIRRLLWAREYFVHAEEIPTRSELFRKARIRRSKNQPDVKNNADEIMAQFIGDSSEE